MIELIAGRMAEGIKRKAPDHPASAAVLKHSLAVLINTVSIIFLTLSIATLTDRLPETAAVMVSFALLRMVSGGVHLKSGTLCVIVSTVMIAGLAQLDFGRGGTMALTIMSLLIAVAFAPTDIKKQSRISKKYYPMLKVLSVLMIGLNFWIASPYIAVAFFAQALLLIPRLKGGDKSI